MLSSPTKYQFVFLNSFPFDWYVIPLLVLGSLMSPWSLFCKLRIKKLGKNRHIGDRLLILVAICARWRQPVASVKALNLLYWVMRAVLYRRIAMARETARKLGTFFIVVLFAVSLAATGAIQSKYSSNRGIQWILVKLWTYNICQCTWHYTGASSGLSKWVATEVIFCPIVDFDIIITVAYYHSNSEYKLKSICRRIHLYVIRLMPWFGWPLTTMDAILATIVLGGRQIILKYERLIEKY